MQYQIPEGVYCPLWRRECRKVCPTCRWWKLVRGRDPNTGLDVDNYDCAISFMPVLQIETAMVGRSAAAATESFRNEVVARADAAERREAAAPRLAPPSRLMIEG
jgi:hypothetical protein